MGSGSRMHKLPSGTLSRRPLRSRNTPEKKRTMAGTPARRAPAQTLPGEVPTPRRPSSREDAPQLSLTRPGPAPRRRASKAGPSPSRGRAGSGRALRPVPLRPEGEGARGGARSRAACSRTSPGFGCVRPAARPLPPPPPPPRFPFAGRRLRGAGASRRRRRDAARVHRPPELPGPGARCGALL